jgi:hypothetical protein
MTIADDKTRDLSFDTLVIRRERARHARACGPVRYFGEEGDPWFAEPIECPWCRDEVPWNWDDITACPSCGREMLIDLSFRRVTGLISPADAAFLVWFYGIDPVDRQQVGDAWRRAVYQGMPR